MFIPSSLFSFFPGILEFNLFGIPYVSLLLILLFMTLLEINSMLGKKNSADDILKYFF